MINRGVDRQSVFLADTDRVDFGRLLGLGHQRHGVEVHAYCLMTNHFHLIVHCPDGGLSEFMHDLTSTYVRHVNDRLGRDGPLFRGRFRSLTVDTDAYLLAATRYIHRNPLDIAGVNTVEQHRWSSHRTYLGFRRRPPWLKTDVVLASFGGDVDRFHDFVSNGRSVGIPHLDAADVSRLIDLLVDEVIGPEPASAVALGHSVAVLAHDVVRPARSLLDDLVPEGADAYRKALSRAQLRAAADDRVAKVIDQVVRLVT